MARGYTVASLLDARQMCVWTRARAGTGMVYIVVNDEMGNSSSTSNLRIRIEAHWPGHAALIYGLRACASIMRRPSSTVRAPVGFGYARAAAGISA
jgi:hypothetical protein